ncbi:hypothetical protein [Solidesulfovibrio sp.]
MIGDGFTGLAPDTGQAHAALKAARELVRAGQHAVALDVLGGPHGRDTPLSTLLRADLLLALGRPEQALELALSVSRANGDTAQGLLCAGHAALGLGRPPDAARFFARAALVDPGRIAARVNAAALAPLPEAATAGAGAGPAPAPAGSAAAVTSLPPLAGGRCREAVASWAAAGFSPLISVNAPSEIAALAGRFPDVAFVAGCGAATARFGRPYAGLSDLLAAGRDAGTTAIAVVNADIVLTARPGFAGRLARAATGGAVAACRVDRPGTAAGPSEAGSPAAYYYDVGFDLCAVDAHLAVRPELDGFFLGLPWWDYALPLAVARAGGLLRFCAAPLCTHAVHDTVWSHRAFLALGRQFVSRFWPQLGLELLAPGQPATEAGTEALLAGIGGRTAALLRSAPEAGLWDRTGFCPHDAGFAAAALPRTRVDRDREPA